MSWIVLTTFTYPHEAHMAKGYLDSEGIQTIIKDELTAQVNNFYSNAIGGVKLLVLESEFEIGIETLLKGGFINKADFESIRKIEIVKIAMDTKIDNCPFCGSDNFSKKRVANYWTIGLMMIVGAIFPVLRKTNVCFDCGKEWQFVK